MIIHDVIQGSDDWHKLRLGIPTCSEFSKILKPSNLKPSTSQTPYSIRLATELITGEVSDSGSSAFMQRGNDLEAESIRWYEFEKNVDTTVVGFVTNDAGTIGGSPDRLIDVNGGVDAKNPSAVTHGLYIDKPDKLRAKYRLQIQGYLWITGREYWDLFSYNPTPEMRNLVIVRCLPDQEVFAALDEEMPKFLELIETKRQQQLNKPVEIPLSEMGY